MENAPSTPLTADAAELLAAVPKNQAEANDQMTQLLRRLISDTGRHEQQIRYLSQHGNDVATILTQDMQYLLNCIQILFDHAHLDMPVRQPPLLDAKIDLIKAEDKDENEQLDMQVAMRSKAHPINGQFDAILGGKTLDLSTLHPKISARLIEAFQNLQAADQLAYDEFYYVRLHAIHGVPVGEGAIAVDPATLKPQAGPSEDTNHENTAA